MTSKMQLKVSLSTWLYLQPGRQWMEQFGGQLGKLLAEQLGEQWSELRGELRGRQPVERLGQQWSELPVEQWME